MAVIKGGTPKSIRIDQNTIDQIESVVGKGGFSRFVRRAISARLKAGDEETVFSQDEHDTVRGLTRQLRALGTLLNQVTARFNMGMAEAAPQVSQIELPAKLSNEIHTISEVSEQVAAAVREAEYLLSQKGEGKR
tara:strand:+ start:155 stop:559 length:405 start_codon:yes stop_codon:yes gene_type:complete